MGYPVQISSASSPSQQKLRFFATDSTVGDGRTGKPGLTFATIKLIKATGGPFTPAGAVAEPGGSGNGLGWYEIAWNAGDQDTLGPLNLYGTATGADPVRDTFHVVNFNPQDGNGLGLTRIDTTLSTIAVSVWDVAIAGHLTNGTTGKALNSAGSAGDPWSTLLPGAYGVGTAGLIIGTISSLGITITGPVISSNGTFSLTQGDDYFAADSRGLSFTIGATPNLTASTARLKIQANEDTPLTVTGTLSGAGTGAQIILFDISAATTSACAVGWHQYDVEVTLSSGRVCTVLSGRVKILPQVG